VPSLAAVETDDGNGTETAAASVPLEEDEGDAEVDALVEEKEGADGYEFAFAMLLLNATA